MEWISVEDQLPDNNGAVLTVNANAEEPIVGIGIQKPNDSIFFLTEINQETDNVTHWMPLPKPPNP